MISYNAINIPLPELDQPKVSQWVAQVAEGYGRRVGEVNFIFVDDEEILRINRQFIQHDYYTDHIGFDYGTPRRIAGDVYISVDTVRSNAELFGVTFQQELHRIIIHGTLHLCGINDKTPEERQQMTAAEDQALALLQ